MNLDSPKVEITTKHHLRKGWISFLSQNEQGIPGPNGEKNVSGTPLLVEANIVQVVQLFPEKRKQTTSGDTEHLQVTSLLFGLLALQFFSDQPLMHHCDAGTVNPFIRNIENRQKITRDFQSFRFD